MKIKISRQISEKYVKNDFLKIYKNIIDSSILDKDIIIDDNRGFGNYIIFEDDKKKIFILLSSKTNNGRNSYLQQFITPAYRNFLLDDTKQEKSFYVYLFENDNINADYNIFIYKLLKTLGIEIINEEIITKTVEPFSNYKEIEDFRNKNRSRNSGNKSTYFLEEDDYVEVFGKTFGANNMETMLIIFVLKKISTKKIKLHQVTDNDSKTLSQIDLNLLEGMGVEFDQIYDDLKFSAKTEKIKSDDPRNTTLFHYNLLKKYNEKKCFLCSCDLPHMIIGAHIHRVADIKNDTNITDEEKLFQAADGDNGFWLCANHDKLFEYGLIYFNNQQLIISDILRDYQKEFVENITLNKKIEEYYYTDNTREYLRQHIARIK